MGLHVPPNISNLAHVTIDYDAFVRCNAALNIAMYSLIYYSYVHPSL